MATKSKGTDLFRGVVSWLCMIVLLCVLAGGAALLVIISVRSANYDSYPYQYEDFYTFQHFYQVFRTFDSGFPILCVLLLLFFTAVVLTFLFRQDRREFESLMAFGFGKIWVEVKLILLALLTLLTAAGLHMSLLPGIIITVCTPLLTLYFLCLDIGHNRRFFRCNIIHSILKRANNYKNLPSFEQRSLRRVYSCLGVVVGVLTLSALLMTTLNVYLYYHPLIWLGLGLFTITAALGTIWWYILSLKQDLRDWNTLMSQITEMYGGNLDAVNHVPPTSNLYDCAMQLNSIRLGIQKAVEEGIKADRTKVELITNVSHDIKTPLTSIVSYIELLKKEPDLPPHVMDYVNTISQKADRLSHIVQDVFEVSKAATGNISLDLEELDLCRLLQQTLAEMDETLQDSQLIWRTEIPETPIFVRVDGQRMYRVFQNLLRNCAQYSLEGSRVYLQLEAKDGTAQVSLRNISKNEITMNGDDLTARFVRGDQNRTTEGSGLGLSIAKSFTEACGGQFSIHTDGDLFLVTVRFPQVQKNQPVPEDRLIQDVPQ